MKKAKDIAQEIHKNQNKHCERIVSYRCPDIDNLVTKWKISSQKALLVSREFYKLKHDHKEPEERFEPEDIWSICHQIRNDKKRFFRQVPHRENILKHFNLKKHQYSVIAKELKKSQERDRKQRLKMKIKEAVRHVEDEFDGIEH